MRERDFKTNFKRKQDASPNKGKQPEREIHNKILLLHIRKKIYKTRKRIVFDKERNKQRAYLYCLN
jgi:hypothetical protein